MSNDTQDRLERIEKKLDIHLEKVSKHEADLTWVKGYIKTSVALFISITVGLITTFFRTLKGE